MSTAHPIRMTTLSDLPALETLYASAFPDEDLMPLVRRLLTEVPDIVSLVAESAVEGPTAHIAITPCLTEGPHHAALLGPLCVAPAHQRQGRGAALIRAGIERLDAERVKCLLVLGDPAYYGRLGFQPETRVAPPFPLPEEWRGAWQSLPIGTPAEPAAGTLRPPPPWMSAALWAP
ncbi:N-acetyltransferase [Gemmobacter aquaticus]|uniref:N-acetyltransferase n=2 Tax=Gemmobacter aquaticus TaxID=490185 RepID=A0A917YJA4_9RHOB|nr:N-acetyltransferase [Gemmobacter aquaticus]